MAREMDDHPDTKEVDFEDGVPHHTCQGCGESRPRHKLTTYLGMGYYCGGCTP